MASTAMRPSCDALCASIGSPATSPMAKIDGSLVRRCSSTTMKPRAVDLHGGPLQPRDIRVRPAADRDEHAVEDLLGPARRPRPPSRTTRIPSDTSVMLATFVLSSTRFASFADSLRQNVDEIAVGAGQQTRRHLDDGDLAAEGRVDAAELEADVAAADDEQRFRHVGQIERSRGVPDARAVERQAWHACRPRPGRQDGVLELDLLVAAVLQGRREDGADRRSPPCPGDAGPFDTWPAVRSRW